MIFIDMDGTLAKIYQKDNYMEKMFEPSFFVDLEPYKWVEELNKYAETRDDIFILSACIDTPFCKEEKRVWLRTYLPNIPLDRYLFVDYGKSKADFIQETFSNARDYMILIDDYSKNLYDWQMTSYNYISIKFVNEVNDQSGKFYKYKIKNFKDFKKIIEKLDKNT